MPRARALSSRDQIVVGLTEDWLVSATDDAFACFRRSLELTGLQESLVADRQAKVRAAAEGRLAVSASFLTGSYRRHTLITPLREADVDIMIVLDRDYRRRGARAVLELVKSALHETYPSSRISRNGQAVTITFADFTVDVVPAFATRWWEDDGWDICNSGDDTWIRTNPGKHIELSSKINQRTGGLLVPAVKMLKAWNRNAGRPLRSFHLEVLAWKILDPGWFLAGWWGPGVGMGTDPDNVRRFFTEAPARLRRKLADPACGSADVGAYLNGSARQDAISKIMTAASRCERADQLRADGNDAEARRIYRQVFGDAFPG
jgi:Second Messenger Oligonucleotide or Dinucleotide Synthetase domain